MKDGFKTNSGLFSRISKKFWISNSYVNLMFSSVLKMHQSYCGDFLIFAFDLRLSLTWAVIKRWSDLTVAKEL